MKLEQHSATLSEQEINHLILNGLPSNFDIDMYIFERSQILSLMNLGKPWRGSRMKGRETEVPVVPMLWPHVSSREETARGVAARTERVVEAVVAEVAPSATVEAITISIISSSGLHSLPHIRIISSSGLHSPPTQQQRQQLQKYEKCHQKQQQQQQQQPSGQHLGGWGSSRFVSVAASPDTSMQSVERHLLCRSTRIPQRLHTLLSRVF